MRPPNPHNVARTWGSNSNAPENGPESSQYPNSSENIIAPPKPFAVTAWNANDNSNCNNSEVWDMYSNRKISEVRDSLNANAETYVRSQTPYNSMRTDTPNNTNLVGSKANPTWMDMLDNANSICDLTNARSFRSEVRPSELIELRNVYEQTPSYVAAPRTNSANSYHYSEHITPIVRWSEPSITSSNPRRTAHN